MFPLSYTPAIKKKCFIKICWRESERDAINEVSFKRSRMSLYIKGRQDEIGISLSHNGLLTAYAFSFLDHTLAIPYGNSLHWNLWPSTYDILCLGKRKGHIHIDLRHMEITVRTFSTSAGLWSCCLTVKKFHFQYSLAKQQEIAGDRAEKKCWSANGHLGCFTQHTCELDEWLMMGLCACGVRIFMHMGTLW
jgi:hypothetical protein